MSSRIRTHFLLMILMGWPSPLLALGWGLTVESTVEGDKYYLSETGRKRLKENIQTLTLNIQDAENNIANSDKNLKTITKEVGDLEALDKEHEELKQRFEIFVNEARAKAHHNDVERHKLIKYEKEIKAAQKMSDETREKLQAKVDSDKLEFERWKEDTATKVKRVKDLLSELKESALRIASRRKKRLEELKEWSAKKNEYQSLLAHYKEKKSEYEELIKNH